VQRYSALAAALDEVRPAHRLQRAQQGQRRHVEVLTTALAEAWAPEVAGRYTPGDEKQSCRAHSRGFDSGGTRSALLHRAGLYPPQPHQILPAGLMQSGGRAEGQRAFDSSHGSARGCAQCLEARRCGGQGRGVHDAGSRINYVHVDPQNPKLPMSGAGADGDGAGASKKPRVAESENEIEHVVSMMQMVSGARARFCVRS
jgi:hypothetical protein